jgi:di/tripeptidase
VSEPELKIYLRESEFPELKNYIGDDLLVTDGTSLLGADDKAAIAAIMNALTLSHIRRLSMGQGRFCS